MSTIFDIDKELLAQVEAAAKARGIGMRDFIASALRQALSFPVATPVRFVQRTHDFGTHLESPWSTLAELETERHARMNQVKK